MELATITDKSLADSSPYKQIRKEADQCIQKLHEELDLPGSSAK